MGSFRSRHFDAVLGIGGNRPDPGSEDIAGRLTWVGIGAHKHPSSREHRGPHVTFDHFCLMDKNGLLLSECAPLLATCMTGTRHRMLDSLRPKTQCEVDALVSRYLKSPPSRFTVCQCQNEQPDSTEIERCKSSC